MATLIDLAALQDRLLGVLVSGTDRRVSFAPSEPGATLSSALDAALQTEVRLPQGIVLRLDHVHDLFPTARGVLDSWQEGIDDVVSLFSARSRSDFEKSWKDLWSRADWKRALDAVAQFQTHQALLGVSFITTLTYFARVHDLPDQIARAYQRYFFDPRGFPTVDGVGIRQPAPPAPDDPDALRAFFGEQTGERYLRDLIRIAVEVAGNGQFQLEARIQRMRTAASLSPQKRQLAGQWLSGFASMAEGLVMSSVEQIAQGASSFTANPLAAAAASTAAAVAARKATQHAFLWEMGVTLA